MTLKKLRINRVRIEKVDNDWIVSDDLFFEYGVGQTLLDAFVDYAKSIVERLELQKKYVVEHPEYTYPEIHGMELTKQEDEFIWHYFSDDKPKSTGWYLAGNYAWGAHEVFYNKDGEWCKVRHLGGNAYLYEVLRDIVQFWMDVPKPPFDSDYEWGD